MSGSRATFVLVHGAWHGGWCYGRVAQMLRARGHEVHTPTLTGSGERSHLYSPAVNASTHVRDILNHLAWEALDGIVLAGHSYGGQIVTAVADAVPDRVRALVYLDAFVGEDGKSTFDMDDPAAVARHIERAQSHGGHTIPPVPSANFGVNAADQAWVDSLLTPQPFATLAERLTLTGGGRQIVNRHYVFATGWAGLSFRPTYDRLRGHRDWRTYEVAGGHDLMIDKPGEVADILEAAS